jgi:putative FmdB family regulatory protein
MPVYEYEHERRACKLGKVFEVEQALSEAPLTLCPRCGQPVRKIISPPHLSFPKTNSELKSLGFSKLVRRDKGVYENVTALEGESRVVELGNRSTYPDFKKGRRKR